MSTLKVLKEYLVGEGGYLLNDDNNGKTVMLSGAWGSGKTHFWQKKIEEKLTNELKQKEKACVYVSLYGKESLKAIKQEVFLKASDETDYLSEEVETFGIDALSSLEDSDANWAKIIKSFWGLNETRKGKKGQNRLKDGGLICFDDFERKSKKVDLNDLFGFISQLAIGLNCKVVIILNSDVFEGEEANVFKAVKEKTVNKFFYFEPTPKELFDSIFYSKTKEKHYRYICLRKYKTRILNAVKETEELNARIYIQVLDNCLEWIDKGYDDDAIRCLVLTAIYFIKTNSMLPYPIVTNARTDKMKIKYENYLDVYPVISSYISRFGYGLRNRKKDDLFDGLAAEINRQKKHSNIQEEKIVNWLQENLNSLFIYFKYGYKLFPAENTDKNIYLLIANFIKTGILVSREDNL